MLYLIVFLLSIGLTWGLREYALRRHILDVPVARSSHSIPTPRGGGMAIVIGFVVGCWLFLPWSISLGALFWTTVLISSLGFIDDHRDVSPKWRLLGQAMSVTLLLAAYGVPVEFSVLGYSLSLGLWAWLLWLLGLVWLINLYNFMDGIDGIAASEAVFVCSAMMLFHLLNGQPDQMTTLCALLGCSTLGFLVWNWPPARIFMGDCGSGFLGFLIGALMLIDSLRRPDLCWVWLILLGCFIVDATWTLSRRAIYRQRLSEAHRTHAYQYASRHFGHHLPVTLGVWIINFCWLFPVAAAVYLGWLDGLIGLLIAYLPLCCLAYFFQAGIPEKN